MVFCVYTRITGLKPPSRYPNRMKKYLSALQIIGELALSFWACAWLVTTDFGPRGILSEAFVSHPVLKLALYVFFMTHITITAMSLSFHRAHTHKGVKFNIVVDSLMQIWLWCTTSMSKLDWVSVHVYHHATSDTPNDPHSPVQKGLARVFFLGVLDYTQAKDHPEVLRIRKRLPANRAGLRGRRQNIKLKNLTNIYPR